MDPTFRSFANGESAENIPLCPDSLPMGGRVRGHEEIIQTDD
jgi:hypothetical protein